MVLSLRNFINNLNSATIPLSMSMLLCVFSVFSLRGGDIAQVVENMVLAKFYLEATPLFQAACVVNGELY